MEREDLLKQYKNDNESYCRLGGNLVYALTKFLNDKKISYHSVTHRIKEFDSFFEKIDRKKYDNPFDEIEDFCGLRIICYYPHDLKRIGDFIHDEFDVLESIDKTANLDPDRFGYRSNHYIVKIKKEWANAPNYRDLEEFKAEIQVRTILMHAWADIEHKLAYKKQEQVPTEFRRKLYQLSALLEIADSQFQDLKNEKEDLKKSLVKEKEGETVFDFSTELNLDSLQTYLDFAFPDRERDKEVTAQLLDEFIKYKISLEEFDKMRIKTEKLLPEIELDLFKNNPNGKLMQVGYARVILDLNCDSYLEGRLKKYSNSMWLNLVEKYRDKLKK
ncbi:MAG: hypothetical protein LBV43_03985 [Prevotella sp.]|jgi:ppGpp synthetase/RelA/SpoT-type nucleotidyltranferase|nr:hypothetical protein [Prevotella sp.]